LLTIVARTILLVIVVAAVSACRPAGTPAEKPAVAPVTGLDGHAAALGSVTDRLIAVYNTRDYSQIDAILTADFQRTAPDRNAAGLAGMQAVIDEIHTVYADFRLTVNERAFAQDLAFVRWTVTGTYTGDAGATATPISFTGITMYQFRDGRIAHEFVYFDSAAAATELGVARVPHASGVRMAAPQLSGVPRRLPGAPVAGLSARRTGIIAAPDLLLTGIRMTSFDTGVVH
jgi:hypothetical protein